MSEDYRRYAHPLNELPEIIEHLSISLTCDSLGNASEIHEIKGNLLVPLVTEIVAADTRLRED